MSKTFTLGEAQTLLPVVEALLRKAQAAAASAGELEAEMQVIEPPDISLRGHARRCERGRTTPGRAR